MALLTSGVNEHVCRLSRKTIDEDVFPRVAIEVIGVGQKIVGVSRRRIIGRLRWAIGIDALRGEVHPSRIVRTIPDVATRSDVHMAIVIKVREMASFSHELLRQRLLFESDFCICGKAEKQKSESEAGRFHE